MATITNSEIVMMAKPFVALQEMMQDIPENGTIKANVNLCLKMLQSKMEPSVMGASASKRLFEMFHLKDRI